MAPYFKTKLEEGEQGVGFHAHGQATLHLLYMHACVASRSLQIGTSINAFPYEQLQIYLIPCTFNDFCFWPDPWVLETINRNMC